MVGVPPNGMRRGGCEGCVAVQTDEWWNKEGRNGRWSWNSTLDLRQRKREKGRNQLQLVIGAIQRLVFLELYTGLSLCVCTICVQCVSGSEQCMPLFVDGPSESK